MGTANDGDNGNGTLSVSLTVFFTTVSGLGYGLMTLLGLMGPLGLISADPAFRTAAFALALATVTLGLLASILHFGHPQSTLRALHHNCAYWLARERLAALLALLAIGLYGFGETVWPGFGAASLLAGVVGVLGALAALAAMIAAGRAYAVVSTVAAWANRWTVPAYALLALAMGSLWLAALARLFAVDRPAVSHLPLALVLIAWIVKALYWVRLDPAPGPGVPEGAAETGGTEGEAPAAAQIQGDVVMAGAGYDSARRSAVSLGRLAQGLAFFVPLVLTQSLMFLPDLAAAAVVAVAVLAAISGTCGVLLERWLFLAEARQAAGPTVDAGGG